MGIANLTRHHTNPQVHQDNMLHGRVSNLRRDRQYVSVVDSAPVPAEDYFGAWHHLGRAMLRLGTLAPC